jgi:hypothetical protein
MALAVLTEIDEAKGQRTPYQWQGMTGSLTANPQVATGFPPFGPVRPNLSLAKTKMSKQMRQFMAQCSIDFSGPKFLQRWI